MNLNKAKKSFKIQFAVHVHCPTNKTRFINQVLSEIMLMKIFYKIH